MAFLMERDDVFDMDRPDWQCDMCMQELDYCKCYCDECGELTDSIWCTCEHVPDYVLLPPGI